MPNNRIRRIMTSLFCMMFFWGLVGAFLPMRVLAATSESSPSYEVKIIDDASIFSEEDKAEILKEIEPFTEFGNALVATAEKNNSQTVQKLAIQYYDQVFGTEDGAVFLIDMDDREVYWYSEGNLYEKLSVKRAMAITDNVYRYASKQEYALCAEKAFGEAITVMRGGRIAQKMKYYGNALLALILALFINYIWARKTSFIRSDIEDTERSYRENMKLLVLSEIFTGKETKESAVYRNRERMKNQASFRVASGVYSSASSHSGAGSSRGSSSSSGGSSSSGRSSSRSSGGSSGAHHGGGAGHRF